MAVCFCKCRLVHSWTTKMCYHCSELIAVNQSLHMISVSNYRLLTDKNVTLHVSEVWGDWAVFHDLLLRSYLYHCVWSVITAHNITPEKRDNNYSPHPLTSTSCLRNSIQLITGICSCCGCTLKHALVLQLVGLVPRSSVSLLLGFSAMLRVSLVSRVTARSLHDNMLGCLSPSDEWS